MQILNFKKHLLILLVTAITSLTFTGCSKDKDETNNESGVHLKAKIGSKDHTFSDVRARWVDGGNYLEITGRTANNEWLSITVMNEATRVPVGKYTLDDATPFSILSLYHFMDGNTQKNFTASRQTVWSDAFELEISKISNTNVEGKFSGILVIGSGLTTLESITVESGSFNAPIKN